MENKPPADTNGGYDRPGYLKAYNYSPRKSPCKQSDEIPNALKKEMRKKDVVIANLRSQLEFEQDRMLTLSQEKTEHKEQINKLEKLVKEQRSKLTGLEEARKWLDDAELSQYNIKTLTAEKEKLLTKIKELKEATQDLPFIEAEREKLQTQKEKLLSKASGLERLNEELQQRLKRWEESDYEASILQQHLSILQEQLEAKERTIADLNSIVEVYQDKLETHKGQNNLNHSDLSDMGGEVIADVCSPFHNTSNELTSLQNEVDLLQDEKDKLQKNLDTSETGLQKSKEQNLKLENELASLQRLNDLLICEVQENQTQLTKMDDRLQTKDNSICQLTEERDSLKEDVCKLKREISEGKRRFEQLQEKNEEALQMIEQLRDEIKTCRQEIISVQSNVTTLNDEKIHLLNEVAKLDEMGKLLSIEVASGSMTIDKLSLQLNNLDSGLKELRHENNDQIAKLDYIKEEKTALECSLSSLQKNHEMLLSAHEESTSEKDTLSFQLQELQFNFQKLEAAKSELQSKLNCFHKENLSLSNRIADVEHENIKILKQIHELETKKVVLIEEMERANLKVTETENENVVLQDRIERLLLERTALEANISGLQSVNKEVGENYQMALKDISTLSDCLSTAKNDVLTLEESQSQLESHISELKNEHEYLLGKYSKSEAENGKYVSEIQDLVEKCNTAEGTISSLKHNLQESLKSISELNQNIKTVNGKNEEMLLQNESLAKQKAYFMETLSQLKLELELLYGKVSNLESEKLSLEHQLRELKANSSMSSTIAKSTMTSPKGSNLDPDYKMKVEEEIRGKEVIISDLEAQLKLLEEENTKVLFEKTNRISILMNENNTLFEEVQCLTLDVKAKDKQIECLETERQEVFQKLNKSTTDWDNEKCEILEDNQKKMNSLIELLETLKKEKADIQESTSSQLSTYHEHIENLETDLNLTLKEKSVVISALCEKEENIRLLRESLEELKLASDEVTKLADNREKQIESLEEDLKEMAHELENKIEIVQKVTILQNEMHRIKNERSVFEKNAESLDLLRKEMVSIAEEKKSLESTLASQIDCITELTDRLLKSSQANDLLVAETLKSTNQNLHLQEQLQKQCKETKELKFLLASKEQAEETLATLNQALNAQVDSLFQENTKQASELSHLKLSLASREAEESQHLKELKEKSDTISNFFQDIERLSQNELNLQLEIKQKTELIESLNNDNSCLSEELESATSRLAGMSDRISASTLRSINNPALKHWMDQFNSLSEKISDMQRKHTEPLVDCSLNKTFSVREECQFENDFLCMIRAQIQSWFSSSESLFEGFESEKEKSKARELEAKVNSLTTMQEKMEVLQKRLESKEREAKIFKEAQAIYKQKMEDLKESQEMQECIRRQEQLVLKEQVTTLQAALEDEKLKCQETAKYYLKEMKVVHKKYQEIINKQNHMYEELSHNKMQLVNVNKKYSDLKEMYKLCEEKLKNSNTSLRKQRIENESLKNELRCSQMKLEVPHRRMSMLPTTSFMQDSFCSNDVSFDSGFFVKPAVPSSRFACDEEEGQFLDQSRNISDLQEGRISMTPCNSRENSRLQELQRRNTLCKPHLRTQYPVETPYLADTSTVNVDDIIRTPLNAKKAALATSTASARTPPVPSVDKKVSEGQRKRKEFWQIPLDVSTPAKKSSQISKPMSNTKKKKKQSFFQTFSPFRKDKPKQSRP